jgi:hypothetical protein
MEHGSAKIIKHLVRVKGKKMKKMHAAAMTEVQWMWKFIEERQSSKYIGHYY